jgi:hypothetical protein
MPLFDRKVDSSDELVAGSDAATRAVSVAAGVIDFVVGVGAKVA